MPLNYAAKKNLALTKERMAVVLKGTNSFYPLTLDIDFYKAHPAVISIWSKISVPYADFKCLLAEVGSASAFHVALQLFPFDGLSL